MKTKSVLIIGGSGFVGSHLALRLREGYKVFATYHRKPVKIPGVTMLPLKIGDEIWVKRIVYAARPDVVIYAAGKNDVIWAELNPRDAEKMNTAGPAHISSVAEILQPKFIYLSNCYTFDGKKGNYKEGDLLLPSTVLGKSKIGGENFIRGRSYNYCIVRSSPLYGRGNGYNLSFLDHLRISLSRGERVELAKDEIHSFASIDAFTDLIARLVDGGPKNKALHFGGITKLSYFEFGQEFAKCFGYDPGLILEKKTQTKSSIIVQQASDYSLNSSYLAETLKIQPLLLEQGFDLLKKKLVP